MIVEAATRIERLAPLPDRGREEIAGLRFFTVGEVCDELGVDRGAVVDELVRRREIRQKDH